jgi:PPIC-type PPIASE domain/SurA N-terminal domain
LQGDAMRPPSLFAAAYLFCWMTAAWSETATLKPVAFVNGKPITMQALDERTEQLYPTISVHGKQGGSPELRQQALADLVLEELIWQRAVKLGKIVAYPDAEKQMFRVRHACGTKEFDAGLKMKGITRAQYTRMLQHDMTIERAKKQHGNSSAKVTPAEVQAYYSSNPGRFLRPDRARIRLILVAVEQNATADAEKQARKKADGLYAQLQSGKDFGELAEEASDDMYRVKGGDIGWMHKGSFDPEFESLAFSLPVGQVTPPFRTTPGFSIMRVDAREPAKQLSFDEVRDTLTAQLVAKKSKEQKQQWEAGLRRGARVAILGDGSPVIARTNAEVSQVNAVPSH